MASSLKEKTIKGFMWSGISSFTLYIIRFAVMVVLSRLLSPKDFGQVAMVLVFISIADTMVNAGFSSALIRKQDRSNTDKCTVFFFNIIVSVFIYLFFFFFAPYVAEFYDEPDICMIMRVICLVIIINSFSIVQNAVYNSDLRFKFLAKTTVISSLISGFVGIILAFNGLGAWALVFQYLLNSLCISLLLWYRSKWRPSFIFSWHSFKNLFSFGSNVMLVGLINSLYGNMYQLVIGKVFTSFSLGNYSNARKIADFPSFNFTNVIQRVTYPALCRIQDDDKRLAIVYRKFLKVSVFVIFPIMCLMAGSSRPLIEVVFGYKWGLAGILLTPICFQVMWFPVHAINLNLLQVKGRSDLMLRLEVIKKAISVIILILSVQFGLVAMCYFSIISSLISLFLNTYYTRHLIQLSFIRQLKDFSQTLLLSFFIFISILLINRCLSYNLVMLLVDIIWSLSVYVVISKMMKMEEMDILMSMVKEHIPCFSKQ